jgi:hypothetical protein
MNTTNTLKKLLSGIALSGLLVGCAPQAADDPTSEAIDAINSDETVQSYLEALGRFGCDVTIDGEAVTDSTVKNGLVFAAAECPQVPLSELGGLFVGLTPDLKVDMIKGFYINADTGQTVGFIVQADGSAVEQDRQEWLDDVYAHTAYGQFQALEVLPSAGPQLATSPRFGPDAHVDETGTQEAGGSQCSACYDEYETQRHQQVDEIADSWPHTGAAGFLLQWASGQKAGATNDASVHCAQAGDCAGMPRCRISLGGYDCQELEPYCHEGYEPLDGSPYCDYEDFTICDQDDSGVFVCMTASGIISEEMTSQAAAMIAAYDFSSTVLPSQEELPILPEAQCDLSHKPDWQDEAAYCANGSPCTEDQRNDSEAEQCNGGNKQVCRPGGDDTPWCEQDYCWQQTGLGNC